MTANEYQKLALTKQADQAAISARVFALGPKAAQLDNAARGLAEEAGECQAVVKRWLEYGKELDREKGLDEVGDLYWRAAQYLDALGYTPEDAMAANLRKLGVRYKDGFTASEAADENRDRAAEAQAVVAERARRDTDPDVRSAQEREDAVAGIVKDMVKLAKFKDYVHRRLDEAGVPAEVPGKHLDEGCRIGGRLDWLIDRALNPQSVVNVTGPHDAGDRRQCEATKFHTPPPYHYENDGRVFRCALDAGHDGPHKSGCGEWVGDSLKGSKPPTMWHSDPKVKVVEDPPGDDEPQDHAVHPQ